MKYISTLFYLLILAVTMNLSAQNAPIAKLGTVATTATTAIVPITAVNFSNITSCDLVIFYDQAIVTPTLVSKASSLGGTLTPANLDIPGVIILSWYTTSGVTMGNNAAIFNITFNKVKFGTANLTFYDDNNDCSYSNGSIELNDSPTSTYYIPGTLTFNDNKSPITTAPKLTPAVGSTLNIPITVTGFNNIGDVSLKLDYNTSVLTFNSAENTGGFENLDIVNNSTTGRIVVGGSTLNPLGYSLPNGSVFFTLNFTYHGGTTDLSWYDTGTSCQYAGPLSTQVLSDTPQSTYYINGSVGSDQATPTPTLAVGTIINPTTCGGTGTIPLTFTNVSNATNYTITYDGASFSNVTVSNNAATITASAGTYNNLKITVNDVTSAAGVSATVTNPTVNANVTIAASATTVCPGTLINYTSTTENGGDNTAYYWKVNDALYGTSKDFSFTPKDLDVITCTIYSNAACVNSNERTATSDPIVMTVTTGLVPSVIIEASATSVCPGTQVNYTSTTENGGDNTAYNWYVNNQLYGNSKDFSFYPKDKDVIICSIYSNAPCVNSNERAATSDPITMTVTTGLVPKVTIRASATSVCPGTQVNYTSTTENGGDNTAYYWKVNDNLYGTSKDFSFTPKDLDVITCTIYSNAACVNSNERTATSDPITMTVNPSPTLNGLNVTQSACYGEEIGFSFWGLIPDATNTIYYKVTKSGGTTISESQEVTSKIDGTATFKKASYDPGNYSVEITSIVYGNCTTELIDKKANFVVNPILPVSVSIQTTATIVCHGTQVTFTPTAINGGVSIFRWYINNDYAGNTPTLNYTPENGDEVYLEMTSSLACASSNPTTSNKINITVNPDLPVSVSIVASTNPVCAGTSVSFMATPINGGSPTYQWYKGTTPVGTGESTFSYMPQNGDAISVKMTSSLTTCVTNSPATSNSVVMEVNQVLPASVSILASANPTCSGSPVTFTATPTNGGTPAYQWYKGTNPVGTNSDTYTDDGTTAGSISVVMTSTLSCVTSPMATSNAIGLTINSTGQWLGTTSDWDDPSNWCGGVPNSSTNVTIPSGVIQPVIGVSSSASCNDINIAEGATLTIASNETGTGSLIVSGIVSDLGKVIAQRYMKTDKWNYVSSPVSGQKTSEFLILNTNVAQDINDNTIRGMMDYDPINNVWNDYFTNSTDVNLGGGKGFCMRTTTDGAISFTGNLQKGLIATPTSASYWNCIGNPYTSAIRINGLGSDPTNFLNENVDNLDDSYGAIYVWDKADEFNGENKYAVYSNATPLYDFQQGQAFMIKMKSSASQVIFKSEMQVHDPGLELKSTKSVWPTIKLAATFNAQKSSTIIAFNNGMTKGLDPTYDAGLLKGSSDLAVYSRLVEDNGIPFAIQALPLNDLNSIIVPIGLDFKTGGKVAFSAELLNLPSDGQVILEDKLSKTFTDLSKEIYKTDISANYSVSDRFQIHISTLTTGVKIDTNSDPLNAFAVSKNEILIKGQVSNQAVATLYDIQGRAILIKNLDEGSLNVIQTPNIRTGIYMLSVKDNEKTKGFKIPVKE